MSVVTIPVMCRLVYSNLPPSSMLNPPPAPVSTRQRLGQLFQGKAARVALRLGVVLILGALVYFVAWPQVFAWHHSRQANQALANQDCELAQKHLKKCISVWSDSSQKHFELARCCWREGDFDGAETNLRKAARFGWPKRAIEVENIFIRAQVALDQDLEAALVDLVRSAKKNKDLDLQAIAVEASAVAYLRAGRFEEAARAARVLISLHTNPWRPHRIHGQVLEHLSPDSARDEYDRSLALKSDQPRVHLWLAKYHAGASRPKEALEHLKGTHHPTAPDPETHLVAARAHYLLGEWPQTRVHLEPVLAQEGPPQAGPLALRGLLELQENGPEAAAPWMAKAEVLAPKHPEVLDALAALANRQGDKERISHYQKRKQEFLEGAIRVDELQKKLAALTSEANPDAAKLLEASYQLGAGLFQIGEDATAVKWMESVVRRDPSHTQAHQALAEYYLRVGDPAQAALHQRSAQQKKGGG